jgi:hypothetical protein
MSSSGAGIRISSASTASPWARPSSWPGRTRGPAHRPGLAGPGAGLGDPCQPYEALGPGAPDAGDRLRGSAAGPGRAASARSTSTVGAPSWRSPGGRGPAPAAGNVAASTDPGRRPQLSPALLANSPNPFHHTTRISFQVPATAGEAFLVEEGQEPLFDPQQRMPYADGAASVQVTIYSLEGRELNTLFTPAWPAWDSTRLPGMGGTGRDAPSPRVHISVSSKSINGV